MQFYTAYTPPFFGRADYGNNYLNRYTIMNETTTQTFQKHLFFHSFGLENPKLAQKNPKSGEDEGIY